MGNRRGSHPAVMLYGESDLRNSFALRLPRKTKLQRSRRRGYNGIRNKKGEGIAMKKTTMLILLTAVCAALFALMPALAEEVSGPWTYELASEGLVITAYSGAEENVVIPDEIDGYKVSVIGKHAFLDNHTMRTLVIPEGVSSIRVEAFYGCAGLSRIDFNAKNCAVPDIWIYDGSKGAGVFSGAGSASPTGLTVVFGDKVARVPDHLFDTASIGEYGHNGYACAGVTSVFISDSVKEIGNCAFRSCRQLENIHFGTGVKTIGDGAFYACEALNSLVFDDALVSIGGSAFYGNAALTGIEWGEGLESIGVTAFQGCASLESVSFVNPLTTIGRRAFSECTALKTLSLPESLVNLGAEAFYGCIKLSEVTVNCANLSVPDTWIYDDSKGVGVFSGAGSASTAGMKVIFGDAVSRVADHLFDTASLNVYGKNGYPYAFVTEVVLSDSVKEIGSCAFRSCPAVESVTFGAKLQTIGQYAFWGCEALDGLAFDDALLSIGDYAFSENTSLEEIEWGAGLESIGVAAFQGCTSLERLALVDPLTTVGRRAFADCVGLRTLSVPETVTNINGEAFCNCIKLEEIELDCLNLAVPDTWIYDDSKGAGVFSGAGSASTTGLKVRFGEHVTRVADHLFDTASLNEYGKNGCPYAFVTEVEIPGSVVEVGACAFRSCQGLLAARFFGADATFGNGVFAGCAAPGFHVECVPGGTVEAYVLGEGIACTAVDAQPEAAEPEPEAEQEETSEITFFQEEGWTCSNGHSGNTGKFCPECGEPKPADACPECGHAFPEGVQYKFCPECGAKVG